MDKQLVYEDATFTLHFSLLHGTATVTVACESYNKTMSLDDFAAMVYPAIKAAAAPHWTQDDRDNFAEWTGQVKRQVAAGRELRHVFTAEEVEYIIPLSFHDLLNCAEIAKQLNALK
jgi:hypothetical protein